MTASERNRHPFRHVLVRIVAAVAGGYLLAAFAAMLVSRMLPLSSGDAVLVATLLSFAVYAVAVLWAFAAPSAKAAWLGIACPAVAFVALTWWARGLV